MMVAAEYRIKKNKKGTVRNRTLLCQTRKTLSVSDCILIAKYVTAGLGICGPAAVL